MIQSERKRLPTLSRFLQLRINRASLVESYECHVRENAMTVNRLLPVFRGGRDGQCVLSCHSSGQQFVLREGWLYFIPCNLLVDLDITPAIVFGSIHFNLDLFYGFDVFGASGRCEGIEDAGRVAAARAALEQADELRALCHLSGLVLDLCAAWLPSRTVDLQKGLVACRKYGGLLDYVERTADARTTVESLARMMNMRNDVFSRTFTRDMGITPKAFLSKTLMRKASRMLLSRGNTVRSVAGELGFSSEYYFSRFFKKHSGRPPTLFQRDAGVRL